MALHRCPTAERQPPWPPLAILLCAALAGCGLLPQRHARLGEAPQASVAPFSEARPGQAFPHGWFPAMLPQFRKATAYRLVDNGGTTVVHAVAQGSSSGLAFNVDIDPRAFPVARWRWNVPRPIPGADNTVREGDDAPARVEFIFSGDTGTLPFDERLFFAQVKTLTGVDIPYATLDYSWGAGAPAGSIAINTWTGRIRSILVRSGPEGMGEWVTEERNVYEDFKRVFGEEPGRITQVVIYTDTDATGATAEAWYGDIELLPATPAARPSAP
jgi:hypothetical protein